MIRGVFVSDISVIIPVHNTEDYVEACVESLMNQTYKNLEIILINDASNDKCKTVLETIANRDNRIKLYHLEERKGVGGARNFGVAKSSGEFIYFLDSDDYLPETTLELLVTNIKDFDIIRGRMYSTNFSSSFALVFNGLNQVKMYEENKYNLLKNDSAQNFLIRRDFVQKNNLLFSEDVEAYSDLAFMVPALIQIVQLPYVREAIYFRRRRNDPITNPSISQSKDSLLIHDFLYMYHFLKDNYHDELANEFFDRQLLNFYRKDIVKYFKNSDKVEGVYPILSAAMKKVNRQILKDYSFVLKREVKSLINGNMKSYKRVNNRHQFMRDFRNGIKSKEKFDNFIYERFLFKLKKNEKLVLFESFQGKSYSDNPKYVYEYMAKHHPDYTFVWSVNEKEDIPGHPKQVRRLSLKHFYYLARAKYWVSNSRLPNYIEKNPGTTYLQTWHGTPLKRLAGDMEDVYMPGTNSALYKQNFFNETRKWDYLISPNAYSSNIFKSAFWFDRPMLEVGYPRNDALYNKNTKEDIVRLKRKLNLPLDKKVILYAPTWRDDEFYTKGQYSFTLKLDLEDMREKLGEEYVIVLRMHYFIASQLDISEFEGFAYDYSSYDDIAELYLVSDLLITDYSSVFFDYANLKRPILFYTYDLEKYRDTLRGFYIDMEKEVPGPLLKETSEVIHAIQAIDDVKKSYQERYDTFYKRFCHWDDGKASQKTVEKVFKRN